MPIPVQQFQVVPSGVGEALSRLLQGGMSGYKQGLQIQQSRQQMRQQEQLQRAMEEKLKQQDAMKQRFGEITQAGLPKQEMTSQLANLLVQTGDIRGAIGMLQPAQAKPTALAQNIMATGRVPGTPEFQRAMEQATLGVEFKQRAQDNKIIELGTNNPDLLKDPQFESQYNRARGRVSQDLFDDTDQYVEQKMAAPEDMVRDNIKDEMLYRQEQKNIPADLKNQMTRSSSASLMIEDLDKSFEKLSPFFGPTGSLKGATRAYAASRGLSDDEAALEYNALEKKIMATAGEVAAGMTKSRAASTLEEWREIVDPRTSKIISYPQIKKNLNALKDVHNFNLKALYEGYPISQRRHEKFIEKEMKEIGRSDVPRGTQSAQNVDLSSASNEDLMRIAGYR